MMKNIARLIAMVMVLGVTVPAFAQSAPASREQEQIRRLRLQLQQVSRALEDAERSRDGLAAQLAETQARRDAAEEELGAEIEARRGLAIRFDQPRIEKVTLDSVLAETQKTLEARSSELNTTRAERERLASELASERNRGTQLVGRLDQCTADNAQLAASARELLSLYAGKGIGEVLSASEPVIGIGRVKLENIMERYSDLIADHEHGARPSKANSAAAEGGG
jgi:chromosome segregation ATPase